MAHADGVVSDEEMRFMIEALEDIPFSLEQKAVLTEDIKTPQDIILMFTEISDQKHQARFFKFAQEMVWADGEYGKAEQDILLRLKMAHVRSVDVDAMVGSMDLEFEEGGSSPSKAGGKKPDRKSLVFSFRDQFFRNR